MEGNEMSVTFENRVFNRRSGLAGGRMGCTLVTGFLGSGKTTLFRHLLQHRGDLRLAVLVNEFADSDVDSLILDAARLNRAFDLPAVTLTHGCACCDVRGPFRESLQQIVGSKHNFDCLLIETSGLARPDKFVIELEQVGIHLDLTVAVVDAETLDQIVGMDIVRKQLQHVDLVLLNKCDLATLGQISNAEDILEELTGGAKSHLNGALMRVVNGRGNIFLTAITSGEEYNLQILVCEGSDENEAWDEIFSATRMVIAKLCKNFCPCRSDLTAHVH